MERRELKDQGSGPDAGGFVTYPRMQEFLHAIVDFLAVLFGDQPERPRPPGPLPPALPPAAPPTPQADPNEPQDSTDVDLDDPVVVSHEGEDLPTRPDADEFDPIPAPPPGEEQPPLSPDDKPTTPPRPVPPAPEYRARYLWCIDNGHGALTNGKRSPVLDDGTQLLEYAWNRDVSARIFAQLDRIGVAYYNVTPEVNIGNFLTERVNRANRVSSALPKLFVSIHANAGPAPTLQDFTNDAFRGIETWYYHGSSKGRKLASVFQRHLIERTGMVNRHLRSKMTGQFYVLRATRMPAILTENGFYNNRLDLPLMLTDAFKQDVADAHVQAILEIDRDGL